MADFVKMQINKCNKPTLITSLWAHSWNQLNSYFFELHEVSENKLNVRSQR